MEKTFSKKNKLYLQARKLFFSLVSRFHLLKVWFRWRRKSNKNYHGLNKNVYISLTSYPPRFDSLIYTLKCLLSQSVMSDGVILWVSSDDMKFLPENVIKLCEYGLIIKTCQDIRSYKKIIPALHQYSESIIITADDDLYYHESWLEELIRSYSELKPEVICHRARYVTHDHDMNMKSYSEWLELKKPTNCNENVFPTSGAGVLYPPGCFHQDVFNVELFSKLCPDADDLWLYWMHRMNGYNARKIGKSKRLIPWPSTQNISLKYENLYFGGNDRKISSLLQFYGPPNPKL